MLGARSSSATRPRHPTVGPSSSRTLVLICGLCSTPPHSTRSSNRTTQRTRPSPASPRRRPGLLADPARPSASGDSAPAMPSGQQPLLLTSPGAQTPRVSGASPRSACGSKWFRRAGRGTSREEGDEVPPLHVNLLIVLSTTLLRSRSLLGGTLRWVSIRKAAGASFVGGLVTW